MDQQQQTRMKLKEVEGLKAFFVNDISDAGNEINDLQQLISTWMELLVKKNLQDSDTLIPKLVQAKSLMELLSTHPNMVKRVKRLSELA